MAEHGGSERGQNRDQVAAYVAEMTNELAVVARRHGFDALGYLLEMARMEAESEAQRKKPLPPGGRS